MHQTSSRLLRMTDEERPFTKDFNDLFSTLIVSLPLSAHRVRFTRVEHTFTSEEAINNLGSLKFSQSNRMPDPKDSSRIVTTTTTTTFSMAKEMARSVCQRFLDARFIEPADGKPVPTFVLKAAVWQLTPKGIHILHRFCSRNGINSEHIKPLLLRDTMQLVVLERDSVTDKLSQDRGTIEVIFRRFVGQDGPNVKSSASISDSDSLSDYHTGLLGVKMAAERKFTDKLVKNSFTGRAASDWLLDCCTTIDRSETYEVAEMFVKNALICCVYPDKLYLSQNPSGSFQPTKNAIYALTERGQRLCGWLTREDSSGSEDSRGKRREVRTAPGGNNNRLNMILQDPALRLLFREFLRHSLCEENLSFYLDVKEFTTSYRALEKSNALAKLDAVRETLAGAYG
jgi:GTPase-activating protein SST2